MTGLKDITRTMMLSRRIAAKSTTSHGGHRAFFTEATKNLQKFFDGKSKKEKEADEACEKALEAAESLREGAEEVKETCEFVRDTVDNTSKNVKNATKEVTEKVTEATDAVKDKMKEPVRGMFNNAWSTATKKIEEKMVEKIRGRALGEAAQGEVKKVLDEVKKS